MCSDHSFEKLHSAINEITMLTDAKTFAARTKN